MAEANALKPGEKAGGNNPFEGMFPKGFPQPAFPKDFPKPGFPPGTESLPGQLIGPSADSKLAEIHLAEDLRRAVAGLRTPPAPGAAMPPSC